MRMRLLRRSALALAMMAVITPASAQTPGPIVVELFTSQGCVSCPPADAFLAELAQRRDVLVLSFHVDYWDYIGWKDPFANRAYTLRQREYARSLAERYVYTPQMIINGRYQGVGSDREAIDRALKRAAAWPNIEPTIELDNGASPRAIRIGESSRRGVAWLVRFDRRHSTSVTRGENKGKTLVNVHVVRDLRQLGAYDGKAVSIPLDIDRAAPRADAAAVLVQAEGGGAIVAAIAFDLPK
jgi:hypothetical protein